MKINKEWILKLFPKNSYYFKIEKSEVQISGWTQLSKYQYIYMDLAIIESEREFELFHTFWASPLIMEFGAIISSQKVKNEDYQLHSIIDNVNYYMNKKYKEKIKQNAFVNSIYIS